MTLSIIPRYEETRITQTETRAVVVGAGIAGLLAARVLSDGVDTVTIIEQDSLPDETTTREKIPQSEHVHAMLEAGRATLEDLLPGYNEEIHAEGGLTIDAASDFDYYHGGAFLADGPDRLPMLCASRPLFERVIRERVTEREGVTIRPNHRFRTYLTDDTGSTVEGVAVTADEGTDSTYDADLVVDATGRASRTPRWLDEHGYTSPPRREVTVDLAYSSVLVERPSNDRRGFLISPAPSSPRGGTVIPVENDRWMVTLFGLHGDHPPGDAEGVRSFASTLPTPELKHLLDSHQWVSRDVHQYNFPSNRWHRYDELDRFPTGLVTIGDAIGSVNPIYGQGMSIAALEALQLHHVLASGTRRDIAPSFFDGVTDVLNTIWRMTVCADFRFSQTTGSKPRGTDLFNRYLSQVTDAAQTDGQVADTFARVLRLEQQPYTLLRPTIVYRTLLSGRSK